jgi:rare lipoprotein A (peptidoglycan hydrolase)
MSLVKLSIVLAAAALHEDAPEVRVPDVELPPVRERGAASWYGDGNLHGRVTASGEPLDADRFTCAHRTLPLQTTVLLVNVADPRRRVWCRINDRGPYGVTRDDGSWGVVTEGTGHWKGILDVSVAAARALGIHGEGRRPIEIRYWTRRSHADVSLAAIETDERAR